MHATEVKSLLCYYTSTCRALIATLDWSNHKKIHIAHDYTMRSGTTCIRLATKLGQQSEKFLLSALMVTVLEPSLKIIVSCIARMSLVVESFKALHGKQITPYPMNKAFLANRESKSKKSL